MEQSLDQPPPLLTTAQAAARLNVAAKTMHYWRSVNVGPPSIKLCGTVRYPADQLERWLTAQAEATRRGDEVPA